MTVPRTLSATLATIGTLVGLLTSALPLMTQAAWSESWQAADGWGTNAAHVWHPDSESALFASEGKLFLSEFAAARPRLLADLGSEIIAHCYAHDGTKVFAQIRGEVQILDAVEGRVLGRLKCPTIEAYQIAVDPKGDVLTIVDHRSSVSRISVQRISIPRDEILSDLELETDLDQVLARSYPYVLSADGRYLAYYDSFEGDFVVRNLRFNGLLLSLKDVTDENVKYITINYDASLTAVVTWRAQSVKVTVYKTLEGTVQSEYNPSFAANGGVAQFSRDDNRLLFFSESHVAIFNTKDQQAVNQKHVIKLFPEFVPYIDYLSPDGRNVINIRPNQTCISETLPGYLLQIRRVEGGNLLNTWPPTAAVTRTQRFQYDNTGDYLLVGDSYGHSVIFNTSAQDPRGRFVRRFADMPGMTALSPTGTSLFTAGEGFVREHSIATGEVLRTLYVDVGPVLLEMVVSPDGNWLFCAGNSWVNVVNLRDGRFENRYSLDKHNISIEGMFVTRDSSRLIVYNKSAVYDWSIESREIVKFAPLDGRIRHTIEAVSPDGRYAATRPYASDKLDDYHSFIELWDLEERRPVNEFRTTSHSTGTTISNVVFSANSRYVFFTTRNQVTERRESVAMNVASGELFCYQDETHVNGNWQFFPKVLSPDGRTGVAEACGGTFTLRELCPTTTSAPEGPALTLETSVLTVSPSPAVGSAIRLSGRFDAGAAAQAVQVRIYDSIGRLCLSSEQQSHAAGELEVELLIQTLEPGVYHVEAQTGRETLRSSFVRQN